MSRFAGRVMRTGEDGRAVPEERSSSTDALDDHVQQHTHSGKLSSPATSNTSSASRFPPRVAQQQHAIMGDALNERLVKKPRDQLFYSRKARPVSNFRPYTLDQYRLVKSEKYYELGKLQPDLHRDDLVEKRKNADRVREFSRKLRAANAEDARHHKVPSGKQQQQAAISKRQKALEFAKNHIPKPKVVPSQPPNHLTRPGRRRHRDERNVFEQERREDVVSGVNETYQQEHFQPSPARRSRLEELEATHDHMRGLAEDIRRRFSAYS